MVEETNILQYLYNVTRNLITFSMRLTMFSKPVQNTINGAAALIFTDIVCNIQIGLLVICLPSIDQTLDDYRVIYKELQTLFDNLHSSLVHYNELVLQNVSKHGDIRLISEDTMINLHNYMRQFVLNAIAVLYKETKPASIKTLHRRLMNEIKLKMEEMDITSIKSNKMLIPKLGKLRNSNNVDLLYLQNIPWLSAVKIKNTITSHPSLFQKKLEKLLPPIVA